MAAIADPPKLAQPSLGTPDPSRAGQIGDDELIDTLIGLTLFMICSNLAARGKRSVRSNVRNPITAILLLGILLSACPACAGDFDVDFGADTDAGRDAGTVKCRSDGICSGKMESLGLTITFSVFRSAPEQVRVELDSNTDPSCCFFDDGARSFRINPRESQPRSRISFFKGIAARGAMLIENERVGTLYLRFRSR